MCSGDAVWKQKQNKHGQVCSYNLRGRTTNEERKRKELILLGAPVKLVRLGTRNEKVWNWSGLLRNVSRLRKDFRQSVPNVRMRIQTENENDARSPLTIKTCQCRASMSQRKRTTLGAAAAVYTHYGTASTGWWGCHGWQQCTIDKMRHYKYSSYISRV